MKKLFVAVILLLIFSAPVFGEESEDEITFQQGVEELDKTIAKDFEHISLARLYEMWKSGQGVSAANFGDWIFGFLGKELRGFAKLLAQLLFLGILAAVFKIMGEKDSVSAAGRWVILLTFSFLAIKALSAAFTIGTNAIYASADFLYGILPLLLGFLSSMGSVASLTVVQPTLLALITLFLGIMERFLLPLTVMMATLVIVGSINPKYGFSQLQKFIRDIVLYGLGLMLTIFTGLLGVESLGAGAIDGLTLKTVKMGVGNFIPLVGKHISDALDAIIGASLLMKNTIGIFGMIAIVIVLALPALKILIMSLLFRGCGALLEPLGAEEFGKMLGDFSSVLTLVFALVAATALLFFFFLFILVGLTNLTMLFR